MLSSKDNDTTYCNIYRAVIYFLTLLDICKDIREEGQLKLAIFCAEKWNRPRLYNLIKLRN